MVLIGVMDFPFSLVLDTIVLPYTVLDYFYSTSDAKNESAITPVMTLHTVSK